MQKTLVLFLFYILTSAAYSYTTPNDRIHAQLAIWNMTENNVLLECKLEQSDATISPGTELLINAHDSPALELTFEHAGKLIWCTIAGTPAWFNYIVTPDFEETVEISQLFNIPNFHYDPAYTGALTYR